MHSLLLQSIIFYIEKKTVIFCKNLMRIFIIENSTSGTYQRSIKSTAISPAIFSGRNNCRALSAHGQRDGKVDKVEPRMRVPTSDTYYSSTSNAAHHHSCQLAIHAFIHSSHAHAQADT